MQFEKHSLGGYDLRLARVRRGGRPTLLMTNAFPQSIRCWGSVWERLAAQVDLLAVDLPGFGLSSGGGEIMRPSAQADLLRALMDDLDLERAFLVGPDIGVPICLWLASEHPERVLGVNVFDGPATWPTDFDPALAAATRSRLVRWLGVRGPARQHLMKQNLAAATRVGYHHFRPAAEAAREYEQICFDPAKHQAAFDYLGAYARELPQLEAKLPHLEAPTLITWGAHDQFVRPSNAHRLHALLPNCELTIFEDAGHFSHEDADEAWIQRLLTFVFAQAAPEAPALAS